MQFIPAQWLELAVMNRPMLVYSHAINDDHEKPDDRKDEIDAALLALLTPERRG